MTEQAITRSEVLFRPLMSYSARYYLLVSSLLAAIGWGMYAYYVQFTTGLGVTAMRGVVSWGVYVVNFVFFIGISHVGALMSAILRLTNAEWRRPITRMAEVVTFASLIVAALFPFIDLGRPDRIANVFIFARLQSPLTWDFLAIGTYFVGSVIFLYLPLIPDIAACRDKLRYVSRVRRRVYNVLSLGWRGSEFEMKHLEKAMGTMTILIIPISISVHTVVSWDFAMNLRTGWNSTIFGPYFVGGALFSGVATVMMVMAALRKFYHLEAYITKEHFENMGKLLLALNIILIYLTINEFLVPGYKFLQQSNLEGQWMTALIWGQYASLFWFQIIGGLIVPALLVVTPRTRTVAGYFFAALLVNMGMWVERFNIVVASLAVPQANYPWGVYLPTWVEISITAAGFAGFTLIYLVFTRTFPIVSVWETEAPRHEELRKLSLAPASAALLVDTAEEAGGTEQTPPFSTRRGFLKYGVIAAAGFSLGLTSPRMVSAAVRSLQQASNRSLMKRKISQTNLGHSISLNDARRHVSFPITLPSWLPHGSILTDVRVTGAGELVSLLYENSELTPVSIYDGQTAIGIFEAQDPYFDGPPKYLSKGFFRVAANGGGGFARERVNGEQGGQLEPGQLQWWSRGIHYTIFANLPVAELMEIAKSMEADQNV